MERIRGTEKRGRVRNESAERRLMITIGFAHAGSMKGVEWVINKRGDGVV